MRRGTVLALAVLCCLAGSLCTASRKNSDNDQDDYSGKTRSERYAEPFRAGHEYTFSYDTQITTGLVAPGASAEPGMPQQKAVTRMQCKARIQFASERQASLQLDQCLVDELQGEHISQPERVKAMHIFQAKSLPGEKQEQLKKPAQFIYNDGVIERVQFHPSDETWSKNIKRAVLNMIQLNLNKNNAQGLRQQNNKLSNGNDQSSEENDMDNKYNNGESFTLPEITIEGDCQTMYTVQAEEPSFSSSGNGRFNVTKSINFKQCKKISDVAYGYQTSQPQGQCAQCQREWYEQQEKCRQSPIDEQNQREECQQSSPCQDQCDPKEVKEQKLSRQTVQRCVLRRVDQQNDRNSQGQNRNQKKYAIERCEITSQYVYRNLNAESSTSYGSAMHAIVAQELVFRGVQQKQNIPAHQFSASGENKEETLLYSPQRDVDEKRFYMYGDEDFSAKNSPFARVQHKTQEAEKALRKLVQEATENKNQGIEIEAPVQLQRLVETMRMLSMDELKQIDRTVSHGQQQQLFENSEQKEMAEQFFTQALAIAGTRNTIAVLVEKILGGPQQLPAFARTANEQQNKYPGKELSPSQAAQALKSLQGLPAPSDSQARLLQHLCQSEKTQRSKELKQACWLTFGAIVNELCQHKTQKSAEQTIFGAQSGFNKDEVCPEDKKQQYCSVLVDQLKKDAQTTYQKVLALKALGNAGLDCTVSTLQQTIEDREEGRIVRGVAIDALRRLRPQMPRRIEQILMPLYLNNKEQPELRMTAFSQLMQTLAANPASGQKEVIDQITYSLNKERSQYVRAFVYNTMKSFAKTRNPVQQEMAKHIKESLKQVTVDDQTLKVCGRAQVPIYSNEQKEGLFVNLITKCSPQSVLPAHISLRMNSFLNGDFQSDDFALSLSQQDIDQWVEQLQNVFQQGQRYSSSSSSLTRGQRSSGQQQKKGWTTLRNIYTALGIKNRRRSSSRDQEDREDYYNDQPFAMLNLRIGDVDQAIIAVDEQSNRLMKAILNNANSDNNKKELMREILAIAAQTLSPSGSQNQQLQRAIATNFNEKFATIPTSSGLPLHAHQSTPVIAIATGRVQLKSDKGAQVHGHLAMNAAHIEHLECRFGNRHSTIGVQSIRSLEVNIPVNAEISVNTQQSGGAQIKVKIPEGGKKIQLLGLRTLPMTYTVEYDPEKKTQREPKIRSVHNMQAEECQREVNNVVGHSMGLPVHIKGHLCRPTQPNNYAQLVQMLMASENQIRVEFQPSQQTPSEVVINIQGNKFEKISAQMPEFNDFYSDKDQFQYRRGSSDSSEEQDFLDMESHSERRQKLDKFLGRYQPRQMYKHGLKISAHCVGGQKQCKSQMEIQTQCDARFKFCRAQLNVERHDQNDDKWTLNAQAQILRPETVNSADQLAQEQEQQKKFIAQAQCQWGSSNQDQQQLNVRIQGEQAWTREWRQIAQRQNRQNNNQNQNNQIEKEFKRETCFLNKFDLVADYKLKENVQRVFRQVFELLKAKNYWNTRTVQQQQSGNNNQQHGKVQATIVIDPITQRHANVTVRTPRETIRIDQMELPIQTRPFPLISRGSSNDYSNKNIHSALQLFQQWTGQKRAQCTVDGRRVETFDGEEYRAPIGKCYNVLAKDCSGDNQFVVMMKKLDSSSNSKNQQQQPKKIKVITPEQTVECQPKHPQESSSQQKLVCKVNGQTVNKDNNQKNNAYSYDINDNEDDQTVQCNNAKCSEVTINVPGVSTRFNGRKASIKISSEYKRSQCGLCGDYDGQSGNEWRMADNELSRDLTSFHRSYSLLRSGDDEDQNEGCSADEQNQFYGPSNKMFRNSNKYSSSSSSESNEWDNEDEEDSDFDSNEDNNNGWFGSQRKMSRKQLKQQKQQPEEQTVTMEVGASKVCFSMEPVKRCPRGTFPQDNTSQQKMKKVKFTCMNRDSPDARQMLRQTRRGEVVFFGGATRHQASLTEGVHEHSKCVLAY